MRLIGLHGKARSGKDEFFKVLKETYGFKHLSFADKVKHFGMKYFELGHEECYETKTKTSRMILQGIGSSVRNCITTVANLTDDERKLIGDSGFPVWVEKIAVSEFGIEEVNLKRKLKYNKQVFNGIFNMFSEKTQEFVEVSGGIDQNIWINYAAKQITDDSIYIITDVRFKNEKEFIESNNGKAVKIVRIDKPTIEAGEGHVSEVDLDVTDDWFFTVVNEHKSDWKELLLLSGSNLIRKLKSVNFFTDDDLKSFNIKV